MLFDASRIEAVATGVKRHVFNRLVVDPVMIAKGWAPLFLPGPSTLDQQMIVYGQSRTYSENLQIPGTYITTDTATFGSGNPIATSKLHWTRLIVFRSGGIPTLLELYPANLIIQGITAKEKDLVWIERLRRSNVLQGEL